ncbi:hypothetical protein OE88DRAFT_204378 [Heliocybe sulcata]|uniref:Uncharacterized protein n=1 Tax=Heliocybe sulcata TaxID=5364 RepID=A0A5C3N0N1_9AGAM|nr:hypothetical protein OE88DRAFT_204378 [Heliocybe sulcata]
MLGCWPDFRSLLRSCSAAQWRYLAQSKYSRGHWVRCASNQSRSETFPGYRHCLMVLPPLRLVASQWLNVDPLARPHETRISLQGCGVSICIPRVPQSSGPAIGSTRAEAGPSCHCVLELSPNLSCTAIRSRLAEWNIQGSHFSNAGHATVMRCFIGRHTRKRTGGI